MLAQLVKVSFQNQCKRSFLGRQTSLLNVYFQSNRKASSENKNEDDEDSDKPIKYSKTQASTWLAAETRSPNMNRHPQESIVLTISLIVFMVYFFILREENDIDLRLNKPLSEIVPGLNMSNASAMSPNRTKF